MAFEEEPRILSLVLWLNYYHFVLFHCFPLFLPFLTLLIKFALCNSGKAEEDKGFLKTRAGGPRVVCVLGEGGLFPRWPCGVLFGFGLMIFLCKMEASVLVLRYSGVQLFAAPRTAALQAPLSMGCPSKNTGVGCHFLFQGIFLTQGSNSHLLHWQAGNLRVLKY